MGVAYHSASIWVQRRRRGQQDLEGKNRSYHCGSRVSHYQPSERDVRKDSPSKNNVDRAMGTL